MFIRFHKMKRFVFRFAAKRKLQGIVVGTNPLTLDEEEHLAFEQIETALRLIAEYAPKTLKQIQTDVDSIFISPYPGNAACFLLENNMVLIDDEFVIDDTTSSEAIACVLVHEAQHARLFRLGFGYDEPIRGRIERICHRAERNFARLLPNGEWLVEDAEKSMETALKRSHSNAALDARKEKGNVQRMRDMDISERFIEFYLWTRNRRN